ncbi:MAG: LamG-like jellyroll fold domain-containing protein [Crocinitomicaceae bacterium]
MHRCLIFFGLFFCAVAYSQPFNNVMLLNGQDDYIEIQSNFSTSFSNEITIEAWIKPCAINGHRIILSKWHCVGNNNQFYFTILDGKLRWAWDNTSCNDGANFYETSPVVQANIWQHIAVRHTTTGVTLFLNGNPVPGSLIQGSYSNMSSVSEPLRIGIYKTLTGSWFGSYSGLMDELRVWDYALSNADILNRYDVPLAGSEAGLQGYYNMDISGSGPGLVVPNTSAIAISGGFQTSGLSVSNGNSPSFFNQISGQTDPFLGNDTTLCIGETLTLSGPNLGGTYVWQDGSTDSVFTVTQGGTYHVNVSVSCEVYTDTIEVAYTPMPQFNLGNDVLLCQGETLLLTSPTIPGITDVVWQDSSLNSTFLVNQPGTYSLSAYIGGCAGSDTIEVAYSTLYLNLGPPDTTLCAPEAITFNIAQPNSVYLWQDGFLGSELTVTDPGLYIATVTDNYCQLTDSILINVSSINANFDFIQNSECGESKVNFNDLSSVNNDFIVSRDWYIDDSKSMSGFMPSYSFKEEELYSVRLVITSSNGCQKEKSKDIDILILPIPKINFEINPAQPKRDESISFTPSPLTLNSYEWDFGDGTASSEIQVNHVYSDAKKFRVELEVTDDFCSNTIIKYINIKPSLVYYIPNAFTPNKNMINQFFTPVFYSGFNPYKYQMTIFNKWGEVVFVSLNAALGWDGTYNGQSAKDDVYLWKVEFINTETSEKTTDYGSVTIIH